jgi:hypothetical protein
VRTHANIGERSRTIRALFPSTSLPGGTGSQLNSSARLSFEPERSIAERAMAFEPINIFSRRIDPRGVVEVLRRSGLTMKIEGPADNWKQIVLTVRKGHLFRKPRVMTFGHDSDYYDGDRWPQHVMGMQNYFLRFPDVPRKKEIVWMIGDFRFALAVPQPDLNIDSDDERLALLYAVCQHLDGVVFTPSSLRDAHGRILIGAAGESDPQAVLPLMRPRDAEPSESDEIVPEPIPPARERVARRALALTAVAGRAKLEYEAPRLDAPETMRRRLLDWVESLNLGDELEPDEWKVLQRPVGMLEQRDAFDAMWRVEGLAVLAWALQRHEMPPDDEMVEPVDLCHSMRFLDVEAARTILQSAELRTPDELAAMQTHLLMLNWRLREYSLRPQAMDFVAFSKSCWIGSFDVSGFQIVNNDLAIGGVAIHDAEDTKRGGVGNLAIERHLAINWIMGYSEIYSETDTST